MRRAAYARIVDDIDKALQLAIATREALQDNSDNDSVEGDPVEQTEDIDKRLIQVLENGALVSLHYFSMINNNNS